MDGARRACLELVRVTAPAGRLDVGILDLEPRAQHVVLDVVDLAAGQVGRAPVIDEHAHAVRLDDVVVLARRVVPTQLVGHSRAAAADHANAETPLGLAFLEPQILDLLGSRLAQRDHARLLEEFGVDTCWYPPRSLYQFCGRRTPFRRDPPHSTPPAGNRVISSSVALAPSRAIASAASAACSAFSMRLRSGGLEIESQSGVSVAPAERTPARTPCGRISSASTRVKPSKPYFEAVYAALPVSTRLVTTDPMLMIVPRRCAIIAGSTAR